MSWLGLAEHLEAMREEIAADYESRLESLESPLLRDVVARRQVMGHAQATVDDVIGSLRAGKVQLGADYKVLARDIGLDRAANRLGLTESLRAAVALFEVVLSTVTQSIGGDQESLIFILVTLNNSINARIREAAIAYTGFLLNKVDEAHIAERRRIARELHDRVGHGIALAHRQLELHELERSRNLVTAQSRLTAAEEAVVETMDSLRAVITDLRLQEPSKSLEKALLGFLDTVQTEDVEFRLEVNGDEMWTSPVVRDEAFLVVREAVRNAIGHGAPTRVLILVNIAPHELRASVDDDGVGFALGGGSEGMGLSSMRERTALIGGWLSITSEPGHGTFIELIVPLSGGRDDRSS